MMKTREEIEVYADSKWTNKSVCLGIVAVCQFVFVMLSVCLHPLNM